MTKKLFDKMEEYYNGCSDEAYGFMGCHPSCKGRKKGFLFRVWAPCAKSVSVVGDFNFWNTSDLNTR